MQSEINNILSKVKKQDPLAQKALYDKYAPMFFGICLRYMKNKHDAEDVLADSFFRIFSKISQFNGVGSFEGWMKRIVINSSLMQIRKNSNLNLHVDIEHAYDLKIDSNALSDIQHEELLDLMNELSTGYRTVFNLYIIEGYKHREIADILGISINTSKSQLILAKRRMQDLYKKKHKNHLKSSETKSIMQ